MNRGSEWTKWDLHVHTPNTRLANRYGGDWDGFIRALASSDISVIGATNYYCFVEAELERIRDGLAKQGSSAVVLGNLEFRLSQPNKDGEQINAHVIFSEALSTKQIQDGVGRIALANSGPNGRKLHCCEADFNSGHIDYESAVIEFGELIDQLQRSFDRKDYLVALCPSGYGSFRPAKGDGRGAGLAREFDQKSDLMFGREKDRDFFLDPTRYDDAKPKAVFSNSDAHSVSEINTKATWVKARPGIEGLKQALFEPEIRVDIPGDVRSREAAKPSFQLFALGGSVVEQEELRFSESDVPINSGFVALIGGRGAGKSVLLDCLYGNTHVRRSDQSGRLNALSKNCFSADFQKQGASNSVVRIDAENPGGVTYLHVRQGDVRKVAEDPDALSDEIRSLLGLRNEEKDQSSSVIRSLLGEIEAIESWFREEDESGELINSIALNLRLIDENRRRIETISSEENRQLVADYEAAVSVNSSLSRAIDQVGSIKSRVESFEFELKHALSNAISGLDGVDRFELSFTSQLAGLAAMLQELTGRRESASETIRAIREKLRSRGIEQDPEGLLDKISIFKSEIVSAEARIKEFELNEGKLKELYSRRTAHSLQVVEDVERQKRQIDELFASLRAGKPGWTPGQSQLVQRLLSDVSVEGDVWLDEDAFYDGLARTLDLRKFRSVGERLSHAARLRPKFGVHNLDTFKALLRNEKIVRLQDDAEPISIGDLLGQDSCFIDGGKRNALEWIFIPASMRRYVKARARISYKGKEPKRLSVGQRGTFYLCMKLATDPFGSPFVFDQPEDDLDNEFIVNELVPLFRDIKQYRQMIVATHNANLVVNADADQVLVAKNVDDRLSYAGGAIEDAWVRESICTILEGGRDAFLRREMKYGINLV